MLSYLEKYNQLNPALRQRLASPAVLATIKKLEADYGVRLSSFIIQTVVGEIKAEQGAAWLSAHYGLNQTAANALMLVLKNKVFSAPEAAPVVSGVAPVSSPFDNAPWQNRLSELLRRAELRFASQELAERFNKIMETYLRGVRDNIAIKETLMKPVDKGGLGFAAESAENILRLLLREVAGPIKSPIAAVAPAQIIKPLERDVPYDLAAVIAAKRQAGELPMALADRRLEPPPPAMAKPAVKESARPVAPIDNYQRTESGKIKMDDIRGLPPVFTPVDEIRYLTVKNFRQLNADSDQAATTIKKKINALAAEGYEKKVAGLQAWKASPVNRQYVDAYQTAISEGKNIAAVLKRKKQDNPEFINEAEFEAILRLNQEMKEMIE